MNTATSQIKETVVPELMPRYVERIDENGHYIIHKESRDNPGFNMSYLHEYVFHDGDILSPDEYAERIHIEFVIENLEKTSSHEKIIRILEAETKERLLKAYRWGLNTLHTILLNKKQSKKFIVQQLAKGIVEWQKELDNARNHQNNIIINADVTDIPERIALPESIEHDEPATASKPRKRTRKSKKQIITFQLGMSYIVKRDNREFKGKVTAFIEHFRKDTKTDKNGKTKNKIGRWRKVCFEVEYEGKIKYIEASIGIDKEAGCEYSLDTLYPPFRMYANNPVEGATPHSASDITPEYTFKLDERYPVEVKPLYGNIKCVSVCDSSVTFEYGAYSKEPYYEQDLVTVPVFVDPETKSQFVRICNSTCYAYDPKQETSQPVLQKQENEPLQEVITEQNFEHIKNNDAPVAEIAPKRTRTTRKRAQFTIEDIQACSDENQVLALLESLSLNELKSWAKSLKIRLEHLKGMNNKAKLSKHIAFSVIYEKELKEIYEKKRIVKTGTRVTTLTEHYYSMDEKTGQISFVFC